MDAKTFMHDILLKEIFAYDKYLPPIRVKNLDQYHLPGKLFSNIYCLTQEFFF